MGFYPARIHVLMARESRDAVVIRRGPSKSVATIGWDRANDTFTLGQWLRGRIYERRSDISPDGRYFLYFAMNGKWHAESKGSWTALSRAPYLKAVGFWPKGDCWNGGGLFMSKKEYWLNAPCGIREERIPTSLTRRETYPFDCYFGGECPGVYYHQLMRDGWTMTACEKHRRIVDGEWKFHTLNRESLPCHVGAVFEKPLPHGWILRKLAYATCSRPGRGCYFDEHELEHPELDEPIHCRDWEWADLDGGRLVWASQGRLYAGRIGKRGVTDDVMLHDFNGMHFEAISAPY